VVGASSLGWCANGDGGYECAQKVSRLSDRGRVGEMRTCDGECIRGKPVFLCRWWLSWVSLASVCVSWMRMRMRMEGQISRTMGARRFKVSKATRGPEQKHPTWRRLTAISYLGERRQFRASTGAYGEESGRGTWVRWQRYLGALVCSKCCYIRISAGITPPDPLSSQGARLLAKRPAAC
jgi:hypothetical protein